MTKPIYDIIIIGAGPAGLTAGLYASRRDLKTLMLTKNIGGQAVLSHEIENYPGFEGIDGVSLMEKFGRQAMAFGAEMKFGEVAEIKKIESGFSVKTDKDTYHGRAIVLALGLMPRQLEAAGEKKLIGRGVCYCATCDGPLYRNKIVAVVGGGNSALSAAKYLSGIATKVYLVHRRPEFRGEQFLVKELQKKNNLEIILNAEVKEIKGQQLVESIVLLDKKSDQITTLKLDGVFIEIGYVANTGFLKELVKVNAAGEISVNKLTHTTCPGIFACGDVTEGGDKQIVIASGQGAQAALEAYKYIYSLKEDKKKEQFLPDWE